MLFITCDGFLFQRFVIRWFKKHANKIRAKTSDVFVSDWFQLLIVFMTNCFAFSQTTLIVDVWRRVFLLKKTLVLVADACLKNSSWGESLHALFQPKVSTAFGKCYFNFVQIASWAECYSSALTRSLACSSHWVSLQFEVHAQQKSCIFMRFVSNTALGWFQE